MSDVVESPRDDQPADERCVCWWCWREVTPRLHDFYACRRQSVGGAR